MCTEPSQTYAAACTFKNRSTHETHLKLTEHSRSLGVAVYASAKWILRITMACVFKILYSVAQGTGSESGSLAMYTNHISFPLDFIIWRIITHFVSLSKWQGLDSWTEYDNSSPSPSSQKIKVRVWRCQFAEGSYSTQQVLGPSTQELDAERSEVQGHLSAIYIANFRAALDTRETISQNGNKWKHFFKDGNKLQTQPSRYFYPDLWILCIHIPSERNDMEQFIPP